MSTAQKGFLSLAVLALLALVLQVVVFSGAAFTSASGNPANVFTAGSLTHSNSADGSLLIDAAGILPGENRNGSFTIQGGGSVAGTYTLSLEDLVQTAGAGVADALTLKLEDVTQTTTALIYDGPVSGFSAQALGTIEPATSHTYRVSIGLPSDHASPALSNATIQFTLRVIGASS